MSNDHSEPDGSVAMLVRYDPEANAATVRFEEASQGGGLPHQILTPDGDLRGLIRVSKTNEFSYLELLSATLAIPQIIAELEPVRNGIRDFQRGTVRVMASVKVDNGPVKLTFREDATDAFSVNVSSARSGDFLAEVRFLPDGHLVDVTFYPVGRFLIPVLNQIRD